MANLDQQAKSIFLNALDRSPGDLPEYLVQACGESEELRREVELLLDGHRDGADLADRALAACEQAMPTDALKNAQSVGSRIGHYQIREQIGEGGMGVVYVAEQTEPVQRKVALKIIKPGWILRRSSLASKPNDKPWLSWNIRISLACSMPEQQRVVDRA